MSPMMGPHFTSFLSLSLPTSCLPSPHSRFPSSRFPVAFLPSPFLFCHPSHPHRFATPPALPFSHHPLHPYPSAPDTPLPPFSSTNRGIKTSRIYLFQTGVIIFPLCPPDEKLGVTSRWPLTCSEGYCCRIPERRGAQRGGMPPSLFPRLSPQGLALPG